MGIAERPDRDALRRPLIELLQPLAAEIDVKQFITGLGSLGMTLGPGASSPGRSQRSRAPQILAHQRESATGDQRKEDQVDSGQKVVQEKEILFTSLV
jgi:hypothetical protein